MKKCTIFIDNEVYCRLHGLSFDHYDQLYDLFGFYKDGYKFSPQYQLKRWDGKIRFIDKNGKTFVRLLEEILPYIESWNYDIVIEDSRQPSKPLLDIEINEDFFEIPNFKLRPYQIESLKALINATSGIGEMCTGSGKTACTAVLTAILVESGLKPLVIVPSTDLVNQTVAELQEKFSGKYKHITVGSYSGSSKNIHESVTVATWQSLQNNPSLLSSGMNGTSNIETSSGFTAVISDETHGAVANVVKSLLNDHGSHIFYRWGITGTMPKDKVSQYSLKCSLGSVVTVVPAHLLISLGYLSTLSIDVVETVEVDDEEFPDYASEKTFLSKNENRLKLIANEIKRSSTLYGNTLVLVNSVAQGQALEELIENSVFIYGGTKNSDRKENYDEYSTRDDIVLIATFHIASTGISIDRIFHLFLVDSGKSFIRGIQSVGRSLRKKGDKSHAYVTDLHSSYKFSKKHSRDRKTYYKDAQYPYNKVSRKLYVQQDLGDTSLLF